MKHRRGLSILLLFFITACQPALDVPAIPSPQATNTPFVKNIPDVASQLGVGSDALKGLTIQVWDPWFGLEAGLFDSQVDDFNKTNEWGIKVQTTSQTNYTELFQNVTTALPTADRPQLVIALPEHALAWDANGYVVDLMPYVNDPLYGLADTDIRDIPSVFWNQDSIGGKRLGIPAERSARFILYNESWAKELGFDSAPHNADDLRLQACKAHTSMLSDKDKTNDGQGGWLVDTSAMTAFSWLAAFGGGVLERNDYRFLTPNNIAALTFVKQLYDSGCAWQATPGTDLAAAFANRKALFSTAGLEDLPGQARAFATANNADDWTVLTFPGQVQSGLIIYGSSYVVLKSTPEQQLASWLFIRWMLSPQIQAKWVETTGLFPLRVSSLDLLSDYRDSHPQWAAALALLPQGQIQPQLASWRAVRNMLGDGFENMFRVNVPSGQVAVILAQMESTSRELSK